MNKKVNNTQKTLCCYCVFASKYISTTSSGFLSYFYKIFISICCRGNTASVAGHLSGTQSRLAAAASSIFRNALIIYPQRHRNPGAFLFHPPNTCTHSSGRVVMREECYSDDDDNYDDDNDDGIVTRLHDSQNKNVACDDATAPTSSWHLRHSLTRS